MPFLLFATLLLAYIFECEGRPQQQFDNNPGALPPLPPTTSNQQRNQFDPNSPAWNNNRLQGTNFNNRFSPQSPIQQFSSDTQWPPAIGLDRSGGEGGFGTGGTLRSESLTDGMQKEVWNNFFAPNNNYGLMMASRPDFAKGGWMAPRALSGLPGTLP